MSVNTVRCSKGHFYDPSLSDVCPQCAAEEKAARAVHMGAGRSVTTWNMGYEAEEANDVGATRPVSVQYPSNPDIPPTKPVPEENIFFTSDVSKKAVEDYDDETMPAGYQGTIGFSPVVGWLVCIDGPSKGKDYRIREGYNYIGRSPHMQICIEGDRQIGRERHASITFDSEEMVFFFAPVDGRNAVRLNNKLVMVPTQINAYDIITIGSTKLLFVPLCGERFKWDE